MLFGLFGKSKSSAAPVAPTPPALPQFPLITPPLALWGSPAALEKAEKEFQANCRTAVNGLLFDVNGKFKTDQFTACSLKAWENLQKWEEELSRKAREWGTNTNNPKHSAYQDYGYKRFPNFAGLNKLHITRQSTLEATRGLGKDFGEVPLVVMPVLIQEDDTKAFSKYVVGSTEQRLRDQTTWWVDLTKMSLHGDNNDDSDKRVKLIPKTDSVWPPSLERKSEFKADYIRWLYERGAYLNVNAVTTCIVGEDSKLLPPDGVSPFFVMHAGLAFPASSTVYDESVEKKIRENVNNQIQTAVNNHCRYIVIGMSDFKSPQMLKIAARAYMESLFHYWEHFEAVILACGDSAQDKDLRCFELQDIFNGNKPDITSYFTPVVRPRVRSATAPTVSYDLKLIEIPNLQEKIVACAQNLNIPVPVLGYLTEAFQSITLNPLSMRGRRDCYAVSLLAKSAEKNEATSLIGGKHLWRKPTLPRHSAIDPSRAITSQLVSSHAAFHLEPMTYAFRFFSMQGTYDFQTFFLQVHDFDKKKVDQRCVSNPAAGIFRNFNDNDDFFGLVDQKMYLCPNEMYDFFVLLGIITRIITLPLYLNLNEKAEKIRQTLTSRPARPDAESLRQEIETIEEHMGILKNALNDMRFYNEFTPIISEIFELCKGRKPNPAAVNRFAWRAAATMLPSSPTVPQSPSYAETPSLAVIDTQPAAEFIVAPQPPPPQVVSAVAFQPPSPQRSSLPCTAAPTGLQPPASLPGGTHSIMGYFESQHLKNLYGHGLLPTPHSLESAAFSQPLPKAPPQSSTAPCPRQPSQQGTYLFKGYRVSKLETGG